MISSDHLAIKLKIKYTFLSQTMLTFPEENSINLF